MGRRGDEPDARLGVAQAAISADTLWPGSWPPSPGLEPWAILICSSSAWARYSGVTPKRPRGDLLDLGVLVVAAQALVR